MTNELSTWLEQSPLPVVARVIDDVDDLRSLVISAMMYGENTTVVVVTLSALNELYENTKSSK